MNSLQAIEDAGSASVSPSIDIVVGRDAVLDGLDIAGEVNGFTITDNGVGFDDTNLDSFFTSDTQHKVGRGGKGLGRFFGSRPFSTRKSRAITSRELSFSNGSSSSP